MRCSNLALLALLASGIGSAEAAIPAWVQPNVQLSYVGQGTFGSWGQGQNDQQIGLTTTISAASASAVSGTMAFNAPGEFSGTIDFTCDPTGHCSGNGSGWGGGSNWGPDWGPNWVDPADPAGSVVGPNGELYTLSGTRSYTSPVDGSVWKAGVLSLSDQSGMSSTIIFDEASGVILEFDATGGSFNLHANFKAVTGASLPPSGGSASTQLVSAVLPASRSVEVGAPATAFATVINDGTVDATGCSLSLGANIPASFSFQAADPTTNGTIATPNTPVTIPAGGSGSFIFAIRPNAAFDAEQIAITAGCSNAAAAQVTKGVNTLLLSASNTAVPDMVALAITGSNDGILDVSGSGAFAVATINAGSTDAITATANTSGTSLPLSLALCQTDAGSGQCLAPPSSSVGVSAAAGSTATFAVFATAGGTVPFAPDTNRIFVQFTGSDGTIRGTTSVAVRTN